MGNGTILTQVRGFTPVIDALVTEVGLVTAVVYGVAWRFCQMEDGVCRASVRTMADMTGINRETIRRHLQTLCDAGYLRDTTPGLRNRPHIYADTGQALIRGLVEARTTDTESRAGATAGTESRTEEPQTDTENGTVTPTDTESGSGDRETDTERVTGRRTDTESRAEDPIGNRSDTLRVTTDTECAIGDTESVTTDTESRMKIDLKRDSKIGLKRDPEPREYTLSVWDEIMQRAEELSPKYLGRSLRLGCNPARLEGHTFVIPVFNRTALAIIDGNLRELGDIVTDVLAQRVQIQLESTAPQPGGT